MLDKLKAIHDRYLEVEKLISSPDAMSNMTLYVRLSKEYKELEPIIKAYEAYVHLIGNITEANEILTNSNDDEMKEMAKTELEESLARKEHMDQEIKVLFLSL